MSESDDRFAGEVEAAAEHVRSALHLTHQRREVTDLYEPIGSLGILTYRMRSLADYLTRTVRAAEGPDYRHDTGDSVDAALLIAELALADTAILLTRATDTIGEAHEQVGHLALDLRDWVCPECGEPAEPGTPSDLTPAQQPAPPRFRHLDGTQLCPVVATGGYQPADAQPATP